MSQPPERLAAVFRTMLLARRLEEKLASIYRAGGIAGGVYAGRGQEAVSAALGHSLRKGDIFAGLIRDQAGRLAFGEQPVEVTRTYFGAITGPMRGRDGNVHRGRPREGMPAMISHLGSMISVVGGMLYARRLQGRPTGVGATCLGDGATSTGAFHEGINFAAVEKLPLVLVIANNQFAYSTPNSSQFACADLVDKAAGYGIAGHRCDGTDLVDCLETMQRAVDAARAGGGPQMVVASFLRLCGHGEHDDALYVPDGLKHSPLGADCLEKARRLLLDSGAATEADLDRLNHELTEIVVTAVAVAQREPTPDPFQEPWRACVSV